MSSTTNIIRRSCRPRNVLKSPTKDNIIRSGKVCTSTVHFMGLQIPGAVLDRLCPLVSIIAAAIPPQSLRPGLSCKRKLWGDHESNVFVAQPRCALVLLSPSSFHKLKEVPPRPLARPLFPRAPIRIHHSSVSG